MNLPEEQIKELIRLFPETRRADDAGLTYFLISKLELPPGCTPATVDALLCPSPLDGYESRLFFAQEVNSGLARNWHVQGRRILERNWCAFSWKTRPGLRLVQILLAHLDGLKGS